MLFERTKGHVLSKSIYPETLSDAQRIIIPECIKCKELWEDSEPHFRNILITIWDPEKVVKDKRFQKMVRSFLKVDGARRLNDIKSLFISTLVGSKSRDMVFPAKDPRFNLILRRIVRGLCYHHRLGSAISDDMVECGSMIYVIPDSLKSDFTWHSISTGFFEYGYLLYDNDHLHSFWLLRFSKHIEFYGRIRADMVPDARLHGARLVQ